MMAKPCERCRRIRYQLTLIFGSLILINFIVRLFLGLDTKTIYDLLLLPSLIILILAGFIFLIKRSTVK